MTDHELDLLIDRALPAYAAEPDTRIADRVWRRVREPRRARWLPWAGFAAATAAAVVFAIVAGRAPEIEPPPRVAKTPGAPKLTATAPAAAHPVPLRHAAARRRPRLTREDHRLLVLVNSNPALAEKVLVEAPRKMAEPLRIEPIVIQPLAADGGE